MGLVVSEGGVSSLNVAGKGRSVTRSESGVTSITSRQSSGVGRNAPSLRAAPATLRAGVATLGGLFLPHAQSSNKRLLRNADAPVLPHSFLPLLLLLEQLALPGRVAAVAFGGDVLAQRRDGLARDDLAADRGLDRDLEQVAGDEVLQALAHAAAARLGIAAVDDHRERVDRLIVDEDAHLHEVAGARADLVIVEAGVAAADRLQPVVEVEHHLVQRKLVAEHGAGVAAGADVGQVLLDAAAVLAQLQNRAEVGVGDVDRAVDPRLLDALDRIGIGPVGGVVDFLHGAVAELELIDDAGRGG